MKNRSILSFTAGLLQAHRSCVAFAAMAVLGFGTMNAAPGVLDTTFDTDGKVKTDVAGGDWDSAAAMAVYGAGSFAGKIVVVGFTDATGNGGDVLVTRYLATGALDTGFGTGGHVVIDVGGNGFADSANAVALDSATGAIIVAGFTSDGADYYDDDTDLDSLIIKLDATGAPDAAFGVGNPGLVSSGVVKTVLTTISNDEFRGVAIQADGKIVAVGQAVNDSTNDFSVVRYNTNGTLDTSFANQGVLLAGITVEDIAEDVVIKSTPTVLLPNDFRIIVVGETHGLSTVKGPGNDMAMIQVTPTGALDTKFGKAGKVITSFSLGYDRAESIAVQPDGKLIVAGRQTLPNAAVLARFSAIGVLDVTFGTKGLAVAPLVAPPDDVSSFAFGSSSLFGSVALKLDAGNPLLVSKILFCGYELVGTKTHAVLLRFNADGKADTSFGVGGKVTTEEGEYADGVQTALLTDGHILIAGTTIDALDDADLFLARYDGDLVVVTDAATLVGNTSAQLNGTVTGDGSATTVTFQWGLTATALVNTLTVTAPVTGTTPTAVNATLSFLTPGLKYYYRVAAGGLVGTTQSLTTTKLAVVAPVAKTLPATLITTSSATLNGSVDAKGTNTTQVNFQWGTAATYGSEIAGTPPSVNVNGPIASNTVLTGLLPHTKYNFRIRGASTVGSSNGLNAFFTTLDTAPVANADAASLTPLAKITIPVLANDTDADGDKLSLVSFTMPVPATAGVVTKVLNTLVFAASATFTGNATFTYVVTDGFKGNATGTVTVTAATVTASSPSQTVAKEGGTVSFGVTALAGVAWLPTKTDLWIALYPTASVVGSSNVLVTVQPNKTLLARSAQIKIGGVVVHTINQNAGPVPATFLPAATFSGLVDRDATLNGNLGGSLTLTTTALGGASGKLILGVTPYTLKGFLTDADISGNRTFEAFIARKAPLAAIKLVLTFSTIDNSIGFQPGDGLTVNGLGAPVAVRGYRHTFSATTTATTAPTPAAPGGYAADYTVALEPTWNAERGIPDGTGYLTMKILTTGAATWAGKLSDGTAITGAATVWPTGEVNMFKALYKNLGSIIGAQAIYLVPNPHSVEDSTNFPVTWLKPRNGQRAYAGDFAFQDVEVMGAQYVKPGAGVFIMNLDNAANNALITFADGEIEKVAQFSFLDQLFSIGAGITNTITPNLSLGTNPALVKLTKIDATKGSFTGTMGLTDPSLLALGALPIGSPTKRTVAFEGVFISAHVDHLAAPVTARGTGFFLLNTLPDATGEILTTTPQLSGTVTIADPTP